MKTKLFQPRTRGRPPLDFDKWQMRSYKMPIEMIEKIARIANDRGVNKSMVVRCAVDAIPEGGDDA
jgi:predicted DNA-binding protein